MGSNPALAATWGPRASLYLTHSCVLLFGVKLRHSIRAVSGALLSSSGLEEKQKFRVYNKTDQVQPSSQISVDMDLMLVLANCRTT